MSQVALFPNEDGGTPTDRHRDPRARTNYTVKAAQAFAAGRHPATGLPVVLWPAFSCGDCAHFRRYRHGNKILFKCARHRLGESHSEASDVRKAWPPCTLLRVVSRETPDPKGAP